MGRNGRSEPPTALQPPPTLSPRPGRAFGRGTPGSTDPLDPAVEPGGSGAAAAGLARGAAAETGSLRSWAEPSAAPTTEGDAGLVFGDFSAESLRAQRSDGGGGGGGWSRGARKAMSEVGGTRPSTRRHGRRRGGGDGAASDEDGVSLVDSGEKRGRGARGGGAARGESDAWEHGKSLADQESAIADARRRMEEAARARRAQEERRAKAAPRRPPTATPRGRRGAASAPPSPAAAEAITTRRRWRRGRWARATTTRCSLARGAAPTT